MDSDELEEGEVRRRVAFDIGSGATKCLIADVDVQSSRIISVIHGEEVPVPFAFEYKRSRDGTLSEEVQAVGISVLNKFCRKATELGVTQSAAIATEVFRKAANGQAFIERVRAELGLSVQVVPQQLEARLGFLTAAALAPGPRADIVCWDSGGASFQITAEAPVAEDGGGALRSYVGELGSWVATAEMVTEIQGAELTPSASPNPATLEQADALVAHLRAKLRAVPPWLRGTERAVAIGGPNCIFRLVCDMIAHVDGQQGNAAPAAPTPSTGCAPSAPFTLAQVRACVELAVGKTDGELSAICCTAERADPPSMVVPKLCLLLAVMEHCELPHATYLHVVGSCAGMMAAPELFPDE